MRSLSKKTTREFFLSAILIALLLMLSSSALADDYPKSSTPSTKSDVRIPEGMTTIQIGDTYVVVPKDGRVRHEGGIYFIETADEYAARKVEALNALQKRVESLEQGQQALREEIKSIKKVQEH